MSGTPRTILLSGHPWSLENGPTNRVVARLESVKCPALSERNLAAVKCYTTV